MERFNRKWGKNIYILSTHNPKELCIQAIKSTQGTEPEGKFLYDLFKYIFNTVEMISSSYDHYVFTWNYQTYKSILAVETYNILMATQNRA